MTKYKLVLWAEWRWVIVAAVLVVAAASIPYLVAWSHATPDRVFTGCILLFEDCASYLAKMRQGADGAWLFHIPYASEEHPGSLLYSHYLMLGKLARLLPRAELSGRLVLTYHLGRVVFGLSFLLTVYRFLAALTQRVAVRRLAWLMVAVGGGFGWLLALLGKTRWLGDTPLDLFRSEGFAFITLYGFPHRAAAQSLLLAGFLFLLRAWRMVGTSDGAVCEATTPNRTNSTGDSRERTLSSGTAFALVDPSPFKWAILTGVLWLLMGLVVPFYVAVAWMVMSAAWVVLCLRQRPNPVLLSREALIAGVSALVSAPAVLYSIWVFSSDPIYAAWAAQNQILSPHPLHYLAAYGPPLALTVFAVRGAWQDHGDAWLALVWVAMVPLLVYLPINVQFRLLTGFQVPLSLLAAWGATFLWEKGQRWLTVVLLSPMIPTSLFILVSSSVWMTGQPSPSFRDRPELVALDWLAARTQPGDVVLTAYDTGAYLPARVHARVLTGHDLEAMDATEKKAMIKRFFDAAADVAWRERFLAQYGIDYVFWGPAERDLGTFDPRTAQYLRQVYQAEGYIVFRVE